MTKYLAQAQPWIEQAENNLEIAQFSNDKEAWSFACFWSHQAAEVALKGFLISEGLPLDKINSVRELVRRSAARDTAFSGFADYGAILDKYYKTSRDPMALPHPAITKDLFLPQEGLQALQFATEIFDMARSRVLEITPGESGVQRT